MKNLGHGKSGDKNVYNVVSELLNRLESLLDGAWLLTLYSVKVRRWDPELANKLLELSNKLMEVVGTVLMKLYTTIEEAKSRKQLTYI